MKHEPEIAVAVPVWLLFIAAPLVIAAYTIFFVLDNLVKLILFIIECYQEG